MKSLDKKKIDMASKLYNQAGSKVNQKAPAGSFKSSQNGRASLESVKNNKTMMRAGNEHNRS